MKTRCSFMVSLNRAIALLALFLLAAGGQGCGAKKHEGSKIVGEIQVDPAQILASGLALAEVSVRVHYEGEDGAPIEGAYVTVISSRNVDPDPVDVIEQPEQPTDADGMTMGHIGSLELGEAVITAEVDGEPLCERYEDDLCVPAQALVEFVRECEEGLEACGGECVDTQTDVDHCGECGNVCEFDHADAACSAGACLIGTCHDGWDDCNGDSSDGCETDILNDDENCGECGNVCEEGLVCIGGDCVDCPDNDNDGFPDSACGGTDCNDDDESINPDADEICDGDDNDCDGLVDEQPEASLSCDDGNLCNGPERCFLGACEEGVPMNCEDGNDCTEDTCDPETGCQRVVLEDGTMCGDPIAGPCDSPDTCLGGTCISNVQPADTECRSTAGACDVAERCDGVNPDCPTDEFEDDTVECRAEAGVCDTAEHCDGVNPDCPVDAMQPDTVECRAAAGACDIEEYCTGISVDCPADGVRPVRSVCRATTGDCDVAERCDGVSVTCPADGVAPTTTECRAAVDDCDAVEFCDGSNKDCPADGLEPATTVCRAAAGACDLAETCDGVNVSCPADAVEPATTRCRASLGFCDVAEYCDGTSTTCPADVVEPATTVCRAAGGACDIAETCDGTAKVCPADAVEPATTVCRASLGLCDVAETCDGTAKDCPADVLEPATMVCRAATGACDVAETCDGVNVACPSDAVEPATTVCRADAGACDIAETCDGSSKICPVDAVEPSSTVCRAASDVCDVDENCDGASAVCPADAVEPATTVCRASAGTCDIAETCDGTTKACPANALEPATTVCRAATGACDIEETCDGVSVACPSDAVEPAATVCRADVGACDIAETCDGTTKACPANAVEPSSTVCRAAAGVCDIAERCDGVNVTCPADAVESHTMVCRPASGDCDAVENCDGINVDCPADADLPNGTLCTSNGLFCDGVETCQSGICSSPGNPCPNPSSCDELNDLCGSCGDGIVGAGEDCDPGSPQNDHCCDPGDCTWVAYGGSDPQGVCSGSPECRLDICNGSGGCQVINAPNGSACGDPSDTACDNPDTCLSGTCRSNLEPSTTVCRALGGPCDVVERCDGVNPTCPADAVQPSTVTCRSSAGPCDIAENCDGTNKACPADAVEPATTVCRASGGPCDIAEHCDGVNPACPADAVQPSSTQCRPSTGACDVAENCDGTNKTCPVDGVLPPSTVCRVATDVCDAAENCDGTNKACPADAVEPATTVCRTATDVCDAEEFCDGSNKACPADAAEPSVVICRDETGLCDIAEYCDGVNPACPADAVEPSTTQCRVSGGICDIAENCDGTSKACPVDAVLPPSTVCRAATDVCDAEEFCDGTSKACPADAVEPSTTSCRSSLDVCDAEEFCDGSNKACPADAVEPSIILCRAAPDVCDIAEYCDGVNPTCPADAVQPPTLVCRGSAGSCDAAETCDGTNKTCPADIVAPPSTVCRPSSDVCDLTENCDGVNPTCPADAVQPPTLVCRVSTGVCDSAENCNGVGKACPADVYAPSGTPCPDADPCTDDTCDGSNHCVSVPSSDPSLNPGWECVEATCDGIDNDCDGCEDEGCGGDVVASVKVIPYSDGPGLRRISGNGWFGPSGRELPGKLVVQLNDGSGNPMPCEPITFAVEAAGTVCYGKGGRFVTSHVGSDPVIWRVCNDVDTSTLVGDSAVVTDEHGQASVGLSLADMTGTTVVSATAESTGEMAFFVATAVGRLSSTLTLPPPSPNQNPALGPLDVTVGGAPSRTYMGNKANYTITIDGMSASTGSTNGVPSAPLTSGGTLTITGTQFTDSQPVSGSCGGAPDSGYPKVWIGGVEVTPSSVTNTQIVVPIPEGLPGPASVIVNDGTDTTFRNGSGCIPSAANAMANLWRVAPSPPVFISAPTGSLPGSSVKVKVLALDSCGNALPLAGRTVTVWAENPNATTPSTAVQVGTPNGEGIAVVSALASGAVRSALIAADVDGEFTSGANKAVVVAVPIIQPGTFSEDSGLGNSGGLNSVVYRGGDQSGGWTDTVHVNPAFRLQSVDMASYENNWMCTVGIIPACQCPAAGTALSTTCGRVYETEKNMALGTVTGEGDIVNLTFSGDAAVGGTVFLDLFGGYSAAQESGGIMSVLSAQISYQVFISSDIINVEGTVHTGWLRQTSEQEIETTASGLELYDDRGNSDPSDDEIRNVILRVLLQRSMP